jgi:hypothetical protein
LLIHECFSLVNRSLWLKLSRVYLLQQRLLSQC